jgi:hypothetical protein
MTERRHPASPAPGQPAERYDIPDVADQTAVEANDTPLPDAGRCDYEGETPPDVAGDIGR